MKEACRQDANLPLEILLHRLNAAMRGWCNHFRPGCPAPPSPTCALHLAAGIRWLYRKHPRTGWRRLRRQYSTGNGWPAVGSVVLFNPETVRTERYRYRGRQIPRPWAQAA